MSVWVTKTETELTSDDQQGDGVSFRREGDDLLITAWNDAFNSGTRRINYQDIPALVEWLQNRYIDIGLEKVSADAEQWRERWFGEGKADLS